ncbi:multidrug transporter AcrB [Candidatus Magnetoovum chiemensis]|nr:multidrug transporter AcrB [Candidatus Magnetoovum chiemensis]
MKTFVKYTLKQIVFLNVIYVIIIVTGIYCLFTTPVENMPPVDMGQVIITTVYYGASADDVESLVTDKIEKALDGLENIEYIKSTSQRNISTVDLKFLDDTDYVNLYKDLRFRVLNIKSDLPQEADEPVFTYINTQTWVPVIVVNLVGDVSNRTLKLLADEFKSELININGVMEVELSGEYKNEFHISLDPVKLRKLGITFEEACAALKSANTKIPSGRFESETTEYMLDAGERFKDQETILNTIARRDGSGNFTRIRDIASIAILSHRQPDTISSVNGSSTIKLLIKKENNANSLYIAAEVKTLSERFEKTHKTDGINVVLTNDSTIEIADAVNTLTGNMVFGIILVTLALWITIGFRNAMLASVGIPFSFLVAVIMLRFTGQSINTISLFSFVLVSGIIVDDAIVILENVYRHRQLGKTSVNAVIDGVSEDIAPIISSVTTNMIAFIPMLLMTGTTGAFFSVIPKAVSYALLASLLEAIFILPIHIIDWGPKESHKKKEQNAVIDESALDSEQNLTGMFALLWKPYKVILTFLLRHKLTALFSVFVLFVLAIAMMILSITGKLTLIKVEFFPASYFRYHAPIIMPQDTSIEETDKAVRDLSQFILSLGKEQAESASGAAGFYESEDYQVRRNHNYGQIVVTLPPQKSIKFPQNPENDPLLHLEYMRTRLNEYISDNYKEKQKPAISIFAENTGPPVGKAVNIRVTGYTIDDITKAADKILKYLKTASEFTDLVEVQDNRAQLQTVVKFTPNIEALYEHNLTPEHAVSLVAGALNGYNAGKFITTDEEVDLLVRIARADDKGNSGAIGISSPSDILDLPIIESSISPIYVRDVVDMAYVKEPSSRERYNGKPAITITSDI